jgi:outer membrane protein, heavy metal efflux system
MNKILVLLIIIFYYTGTNAQDVITKLSLKDAVEIGIKNNPEIKSSFEKINAAEGRFWNGISLPSPEISANYDYIPTNKSLKNYGEKSFGINQSIEFPLNYFLRGSMLSKEKRIAEYSFKQTQLEVESKIKTAYFNLLAIQEQLKIAEENLVIAEDFSKKAEIRYNAGEGTNLEKLTAKVQYTEAINNIEVQKNNLISASAMLNYELGNGKDDSKEFQLIDKMDFIKLEIKLDELIKDAEVTNSQLKINELRVGSSVNEKNLAWASILPNLNLAYYKQTVDADKFYGVSFGITVPLWFMFDHRGKIEEASANLSIAEFESRSAKNLVYLRIKNAFTEFTNSEKQVQLYQSDILPQAEEVYRTASSSYEAGELTYLEFLQAKQTIINARSNYINALLGYNLSIVSLEESLGKRLK